MKKILFFLAVIGMLLLATSCGGTKILHCDHCNKEVTVGEKSNMEESWIIYCEDCNEKLFGDDPILGAK